jgi:hypothetical protein
MKPAVISVDGGNTKTELVLASAAGDAGAFFLCGADAPVAGAALAALDALGAPPSAGERLRTAFREGLAPEVVA